MGITILENWALDLMNDDMIRWVLDPRRYSFYIYFWFFLFFFSHARKFTSIYIYKNIKNTIRNPKKLPECHCIGKRLKYPWISQKIMKMRVWLTRSYCWRRWTFSARFPANKWLILVYLRERILMTVVSTAIDGGWGRIVGLKLRVANENRSLFPAR
jgi:hypothetical protein